MKSHHLFPVLLLLITPIFGSAQIVFNTEVEQTIDSMFNEYDAVPGAASAVVSKGKVLYQKGFGMANLENDVEVTPKTVFETGAVAMHFTATAILLLEKDDQLSLDDPIQKYLTSFPKYSRGEVTIRHCLHHSSGLRDYLELIKMTGRNQHIDFDNKDGYDLLQKQKELTIVPGSDYRYSHSNYLVLAFIVEEVSGMSIGAFSEQNIFAPLGMNNTFFYEDNEQVIKNRALLYGSENGEFKLKQNYSFTACGDGRLYSTLEDMTIWMTNLSSSSIGSDEKFMEKLYERGVLNNGDEMSYALGLEYGSVNGREDIGHSGWFGGATSMILITPASDLSIITMGNNIDYGVIGKAFQINSLLFDDANYTPREENETPTISLSKSKKEKFCGAYFSSSTGYDYRIYMKDKELYLNDGENEDAMLKPISKNEFMLADGINWTTIKFGNKENKKVMSFKYSQRPPIPFIEFQPVHPSEEELNDFTGKYYSDELKATYDLKVNDKKLQVFIGELLIAQFDPLMENLFNSDHDGYLKFETGLNGEISKFTINDYSLGSLSFQKK